MECVTKPNINCCQNGNCDDNNCPSTHACCWQDPKNGNKATLGLCVKRDADNRNSNCDFNKGLPFKTCRDSSNYVGKQYNKENFQGGVIYREGYNDNEEETDDSKDKLYNEWNDAFFILFILIVALVFFCAFLHLSCMKK